MVVFNRLGFRWMGTTAVQRTHTLSLKSDQMLRINLQRGIGNYPHETSDPLVPGVVTCPLCSQSIRRSNSVRLNQMVPTPQIWFLYSDRIVSKSRLLPVHVVPGELVTTFPLPFFLRPLSFFETQNCNNVDSKVSMHEYCTSRDRSTSDGSGFYGFLFFSWYYQWGGGVKACIASCDKVLAVCGLL